MRKNNNNHNHSIYNFQPRPKTDNQKYYLESIENSFITICDGPAGTGKTLLSCYCAVKALVEGKIERIIVTRPAIEACGERIGYVPGNASEKMEGYTAPVLENFKKILDFNTYNKIKQQIEVIPMAFMRGRDFDNCFVLVEEAQNCSIDQFRMILTRITDRSKMVISGDIEQSDMRGKCCLDEVGTALKDIDGITYIKMDNEDIVRSKYINLILNKLQDIK